MKIRKTIEIGYIPIFWFQEFQLIIFHVFVFVAIIPAAVQQGPPKK